MSASLLYIFIYVRSYKNLTRTYACEGAVAYLLGHCAAPAAPAESGQGAAAPVLPAPLAKCCDMHKNVLLQQTPRRPYSTSKCLHNVSKQIGPTVNILQEEALRF